MKKNRFKTAFILGAGLGLRLRPLTERCPKPLLPLCHRPIITYAMDHLIASGVRRFIINTHHCPEVYHNVFPDNSWRGIPIVFRYEPVLLETGGGLKNIEDLLIDDEAIICYNGDIISDIPLERLIEEHEKRRPEATLAVRSKGPLLNVDIDEKGWVCDLRFTLGRKGVKTCLFTGIYTVETAILGYIEPGKVESIVPVFLRRICHQPGSIQAVVIDEGSWYDIGSVEAYETLEQIGIAKDKEMGCH